MSGRSRARACCDNSEAKWGEIRVADGLLRLRETLPSGQSFRWIDGGVVEWHEDEMYREWAGVLNDSVVLLREREATPTSAAAAVDMGWSVYYRGSDEVQLRDYFRADVDLSESFERFCEVDDVFRSTFARFRGARILRQPPTENLFAFICSSNNNIKRITGMVTHLAAKYGTRIGEYSGRSLYAFPTAETLATCATESDLRDAGFGYRAKFIVGTAKVLVKLAEKEKLSAEEMLLSLRGRPRAEVAKFLTQFPGIGRKVAGCIALMSLDCFGEIPVDTHVWQIAQRYVPSLKTKSLTDGVYTKVGNYFREKFGEDDAGLAHNTLFIAELAEFKDADAKGVKGEKAMVVKREVGLSKNKATKSKKRIKGGIVEGQTEPKEEAEMGEVKSEENMLMKLARKKPRRGGSLK